MGDFTVDLFGSDAARAILERYGPAPMQMRIARAELLAGRAMVPIIRREIKASIHGHGRNPGMLARKVSARRSRMTALATAGGISTIIGSTAPHNHLVIRGHRLVGHKPGKRDLGGHTRVNPFINRTSTAAWAVAGPIMRKEVFGG